MAEVPAHLRFNVSDRGLKYMPTIYGEGVSLVRVYESSLAEEPRIWVYVEDRAGERIAQAHMPLDEARKVAEQIILLVENYYQIQAATHECPDCGHEHPTPAPTAPCDCCEAIER